MNKYWQHITVGIVAVLLVGTAIPKLTVHDIVPLTEQERSCVETGIRQQFDNPLQRLALALGKSAVIEKADGQNTIVVQSYTLYRIPLAATHLFNISNEKVGIVCDWASGTDTTLPPQTITPLMLTDGDTTGLGVFHDSPIVNGVKAYQSERLGISFNYPPGYLLFEGKGEGVGGAEYYVITVAPEMYVREAIARIGGGEWPASMHLAFYREPNLSVSLEQWIRTKPQSNFIPSDPAQEGVITPAVVAGIPAIKYRVRGLYDSDYFAFTYGEWVALAAADDMGENTSRDFQTILSSIVFTN